MSIPLSNKTSFLALTGVLYLLAISFLNAEGNKGLFTIPEGQPVNIILPSGPTMTESFAAEELSRYLTMMRGKPVTVDSANPSAFSIYLGHTKASDPWRAELTDPLPETAEEVFVVAIKEDQAVLAGGGDRGTLYAAYAFLEDLGCAWLEPGEEGDVVPVSPDLTLTVGERIERPAMTIRHLGTSGQLPDPLNKAPDQIVETVDWMVKNRLNFSFALRPQLLYRIMPPADRNIWEKRGGMVKWQHIVHNFEFIFPNERYFEEHPEYYALYKGRRVPLGPEGGNLALTNPDVRRLAAEFSANWFDQNPDGRVVPMVPPDGAIKWDESPEGMALGGKNFVRGPEGSMSRRMAEFSAAVADQLAEDYPDRYILNLAYANYVEPYEGLTLPKNVIAQVAHGYAGQGSFIHSIYSDRNEEARDIFEAWANSGAGGIGIWDYFILHVPDRAGSPKTPLGLIRVARDMIEYLGNLEPEYKVYFTQAGNEHWQYNALIYWAVAQLAWNPEITVDQLIETWTKAAFGNAWEPAYDYYKALEETYDNDEWTVGIWREVNVPSPLIFTESFLSRAQSDLKALKAGIAEDNVLGQDLYRRMQASLDFAESTVAPQKIFGKSGEWVIERGEDAYVINAAGPDVVEGDALFETLTGDSDERTLKHMKFRGMKRSEPISWLRNDQVEIGILPGIGGRVIRMIDRRSGENLLFEPELDRLSNPGAPYFRYGGYEEYTSNAFASPGWETPMQIEYSDADKLILKGQVDGVAVTRGYILEDGAASRLRIRTTLRNTSAEPRQTRIRIHPEFKVDETLDETKLIVGEDGDFEVATLYHSDILKDTDATTWGVYSPANQVAVLNDFKADQVEQLHLHVDPSVQSFNLEVFGEPVILQPGESVVLEHQYRIFSGNAATRLFPDVAVVERADPRKNWIVIEESETAGDGVSGETVYRLDKGPVRIIGVPSEIGLAGAIECSFRLDVPPAEIQDAVLFSFGKKDPDWMMARISKGILYLYRTRGDSPFDGADEGWSKLEIDITEMVEPDLWYDLTLAWDGSAGTRAGRIMIALDGEILDDRSDQTIRAVTNAPALLIGGNTRAINRGKFPGSIDQVRVYESIVTDADDDLTPLVRLDKRPL
ncbi:DUF4838 domain-containing protein [Rubellicoccus peritrichatus]|uniref:DUF4838 domain-containing protein n=1 Tax=Rubellicoccus peritrichatus TaxID=3080537 RepID=A0AAQ3LCF2_9BACT|nr:DUF4838 domain-containing protein [Puniceicoccus sp. CR14]WOO41919.1 DUF4838 domain-containing protein [Puniceicoccus sp. CR14]